MTDEAQAAPAQDAVQPSQIISGNGTDPNAQGRGAQLPETEQSKEPAKLSTRDAIAKAFDDAEAKSKAEVDDKAAKAVEDAKTKIDDAEKKAADKTEVKEQTDKQPQAKDDKGRFVKAEKTDDQAGEADKSAAEKPATGQEGQDRRQSEGRQHSEPPARFLPEARTKWANVPNEVKAEFHRVSQEMEGEIAKHKQSSERYEQLRQYDEVAKTNGRDLKDSLEKVMRVEKMLASNPIAGLDAILKEIGPRKPDGSTLSLMEVAQHIVQNPQAYQRAQQMPQPVQQQDNKEIQALRAEIQSMRAEQTVVPVIQEFSRSHPDFDVLSPQIERILKSNVIEQLYGPSLSLEQKLAEAYRMAGGNPPSRSEPQPVIEHSEAKTARPDIDPDGQKSIKGAPTAGQTGQPTWKPKTNREALERAFASIR